VASKEKNATKKEKTNHQAGVKAQNEGGVTMEAHAVQKKGKNKTPGPVKRQGAKGKQTQYKKNDKEKKARTREKPEEARPWGLGLRKSGQGYKGGGENSQQGASKGPKDIVQRGRGRKTKVN